MDSAVLPGNDAKCKEGVDSFASSTGLVCELGSADRAKCWAGVRFGVFSGISICRLHSHCLASQGGRESTAQVRPRHWGASPHQEVPVAGADLQRCIWGRLSGLFSSYRRVRSPCLGSLQVDLAEIRLQEALKTGLLWAGAMAVAT